MSDYGNIIGMACPGTLGDSSRYNIDGKCFASDEEASIMVGKIVNVKSITDGYKEISEKFSPNTIPYGVAMRTNMIMSKDDEGYMVYEAGDPINVISNGRAWVLTQDIDSAPNFGDPARVATDGFASAAGFEIPGWSFTGGWQKWNGLFYIVEIQINQSAPFIYYGEQILVNGCHIDPNLPSPQSNIQIVKFTADVSPKNATNILGKWSIDDTKNASLIDNNDNTCQVIPNGQGNFTINVHWQANDRSGVQASIPFTFVESGAVGL